LKSRLNGNFTLSSLPTFPESPIKVRKSVGQPLVPRLNRNGKAMGFGLGQREVKKDFRPLKIMGII